MHSAFGIEHGEISKVRLPKRPMRGLPGGRRPTRAQRATQGQGIVPTRTERAKGTLNRVGEADISLKGIGSSAGIGLKKVGGFLEKRPGLTGTALVGGGGAAGYKILSQPRKKKS